MNEEIKTFEWDDDIEKESSFTLLEEGVYDFTVESFSRGRFDGSEKLPPCNKAIVKIGIDTPKGSALITENLLLCSNLEWKLSEFFTSIGLKQKGEKLKMDWSKVAGAKGKCEVVITDSIKIDDDKKYNKIKKFLPWEEKGFKIGEF